MSELFTDAQALVVFVVLGMFALIMALTWGDSCRAIAEFFAPLKRIRFQFSLRSLLLFTTMVAVLLKLGVHLEWLPGWAWLDKFAVLALAVIVLGVVGVVICSSLSTSDRRPRINHSREIFTDDGQPAFPAGGENTRKKAKRIRFNVRKRSIIPFKW